MKEEYHINGVFMRILIRGAAPFLTQQSRNNEKKGFKMSRKLCCTKPSSTEKKKATFRRVARFCPVTPAMKFGTWDSHASRASVRDDPRGCFLAIFYFRAIPGAWKQNEPGDAFYDPFFKAFKIFRSPALFEPNVWLRISEQELQDRVTTVMQFYKSTMNMEYDLVHSMYIPAKTEGVTVIQEARGAKQVGAMPFYVLTHKSSPFGRLPVKAPDLFKKVYSLPPPHPKELLEETMFTIYPTYELRMDFYIGILKALTMMSETVYNIFRGTKFVYVALVSAPMPTLSCLPLVQFYGRASVK